MGLILVDSSVWIDALSGHRTLQTDTMYQYLAIRQPLTCGDLIKMEVLQGSRGDRAFRYALAWLGSFDQITIVDDRVIVAAAENYRRLRALGITVRSTIDTLIATRCILDTIPLLYRDRDFDHFVTHLGLVSAMLPSGAPYAQP